VGRVAWKIVLTTGLYLYRVQEEPSRYVKNAERSSHLTQELLTRWYRPCHALRATQVAEEDQEAGEKNDITT